MQLTNILLAFMASAVVVMAAPAAEVNENNAAAWKCPKGWLVCGTCNGGDCKVAGTNRHCRTGSCTKQSGAGDGTICGSPRLFDITMDCPGRRG